MTLRWNQVSSKVGDTQRYTDTHARTHTQTATERCNCNACVFQEVKKSIKMDLNKE